MSESPNYPAGERTSISEAVTTALRQPSFLRVMLVLAATVVVLVGIRLGAPILNPIFFAVVLTLLSAPSIPGCYGAASLPRWRCWPCWSC